MTKPQAQVMATNICNVVCVTHLHGLNLLEQGPCCLRQLGCQLLVAQLCTLAAALQVDHVLQADQGPGGGRGEGTSCQPCSLVYGLHLVNCHPASSTLCRCICCLLLVMYACR
jgi:hypothetical protein